MKIILSTLNAKFIHSSLALHSLAAYASKEYKSIVIKEYSINNELLNILSDIYREQPNVIGLACYIWNIEMTLKLAAALKEVLPLAVIILGGPEVSYDPAKVLENNPAVDYIIMGEGEETLAALLKVLTQKTAVEKIPGLAYRKENNIIVSGGPQVVRNLDKLPFPYADGITDLKDKIIYYETSRGCPFSCKYCLSSTTHGVRYFSLERVIQELDFFIRHQVRQVKFVDRTFNVRREHYLAIFDHLAQQACDTNFHFEITADILDAKALELLSKVPRGRFQFEIGIQSTHPQALAACGRHNNWETIEKNVTRLRMFDNIHLHLDLIVGLPFEGLKEFRKSFNAVCKLRPDMLQIGFLKLLKGSDMRRTAGEHEYIALAVPPYEVLGNKYLGYEEIRQLKILENVFEYYYNSGKFKHSLEFVVNQLNGDAYEFFNDYTNYWEANGLYMAAHSTKALFEYINQFLQQYKKVDYTICQELLKFDIILCERGNIRPGFLGWEIQNYTSERDAFWRNAAIIEKYLPGYVFGNWREVNKNFHIEVFSVDIIGCLKQKADKQLTPVLFSFNCKYPQYQTIAADDFLLRKET